jgi:predicted alpha/beta hydrolase family esterase
VTSFLIVHGWQNRRPEGHWQHWLASQLEADGHAVYYPQLPDADFPEPAGWVAGIRQQLGLMRDRERVVICHSLGCMAWFHHAAGGRRVRPVDRIVFVAPPSPAYLADEPAIAAFQAPRVGAKAMAASVRTQPRLVCSDNDPYCADGADRAYPDGFDVDLIPGAGHLDIPAGYGPWPSILAWCNDPAVRITGALALQAPDSL